MTAYGAATATTAAYDIIRDAATPGGLDKPAKATAQSYREALERLWILDPLPAWSPTSAHLRRLGSAPRHPWSIPPWLPASWGSKSQHCSTSAPRAPLIPRDGTLFGQLFESLVTLGIRVYAQAVESRIGHLRTHGGEHEVDPIVERGDHRVVAVEVKLARTVRDDDLRKPRPRRTWRRRLTPVDSSGEARQGGGISTALFRPPACPIRRILRVNHGN